MHRENWFNNDHNFYSLHESSLNEKYFSSNDRRVFCFFHPKANGYCWLFFILRSQGFVFRELRRRLKRDVDETFKAERYSRIERLSTERRFYFNDCFNNNILMHKKNVFIGIHSTKNERKKSRKSNTRKSHFKAEWVKMLSHLSGFCYRFLFSSFRPLKPSDGSKCARENGKVLFWIFPSFGMSFMRNENSHFSAVGLTQICVIEKKWRTDGVSDMPPPCTKNPNPFDNEQHSLLPSPVLCCRWVLIIHIRERVN